MGGGGLCFEGKIQNGPKNRKIKKSKKLSTLCEHTSGGSNRKSRSAERFEYRPIIRM